MKPETDEEKEAREKREWEEQELDTDPSKLKIIPRRRGPPEVRPFKLSSVGPDYTIGLFGKRREGKSFFMRWLLWAMRDKFPRGYVNLRRRCHNTSRRHARSQWNQQPLRHTRHCRKTHTLRPRLAFCRVVFTNTKLNGFWQQYIPAAKVFDGYRPGVMHEIQKNQANLVTWMQNHPEEAKGINPYFFIVMDDCISQVRVSER